MNSVLYLVVSRYRRNRYAYHEAANIGGYGMRQLDL